ncbi:FHA domain-containing protein [Streptomyces sp. NPDC002889]|uniref:FHA domain-containing protein n=1 Tax=Streptomyces sp. NPDC002889 TaxID=3364669 RepID=UPI003684F575
MTSSYEFQTYPAPARISDAERERVLGILREGAAEGKLSHDTFVHRMELVLVARRPEELEALTADLAQESPWSRRLYRTVGRVSAFSVRLRRAWQTEKLPPLLLPEPSPFPLRIGRDPANGLRLSHDTVSRLHAELSRQGQLWVLRDLGSTNGTTVNGRRVTGSIVVQDGDMVGFGRMTFRLTAR